MLTTAEFAAQFPTLLAYLDPGSGSMLLQVMIAGLLSGMFFLKSSCGFLRLKLDRLVKRGGTSTSV